LEEPVGYSREFISEGEAKGRLCGGNLTIIASSLGTPYEIDTKGKIIFMEDVGEELYRIDRMLNQLRLAGKFKDCAGLIFGDFGEMEGAQDLAALVRELNPSVPVLYNFRCGHCIPTASLPLGAMARLNSYKNLLEII
jgi:muramoyltetrapeptide carboxypeptidase